MTFGQREDCDMTAAPTKLMIPFPSSASVTSPPSGDTAFLDRPRGLAYLSFTDAWERFSFYGCRILSFRADADAGAGIANGQSNASKSIDQFGAGHMKHRILGMFASSFALSIITPAIAQTVDPNTNAQRLEVAVTESHCAQEAILNGNPRL